jgi:hypothetical protein
VKLRIGLAVVAAGLVLVSGCSANKDKPGAISGGSSPSAADAAANANALAVLGAAAQKTLGGSYKMNLTMKSTSTNVTMDAKVDPSAKTVELVMDNQGQTMTIRMIGTDMYLSGLPTLQGKWMHADVSKVPGAEGLLDSFDQTFALLPGVVDLKEGPPGTFTGFVDAKAALDKATTDAQKNSLSKIVAAGNGEKLPFSAKVADGYLVETTTSYKVEMNGTTEEATVVTKMSDFGKVGKITAPDQKDIIG